ncbi:hypothetical protein [Mucilaginibacter jinjuensis]|uniref:Paeninodin family lasso peptide n=1 Tax=Mucilaginibacter jinjuensis TaxID=1176721 RepID=A0ABY7TEM2_9SPHI|nr:hypothetical protein [Mucilaginibacter jinjuensis]WCT14067.1 hypothetical protein PQO05_08980 [Mucilaginibacter jinjuensis]
MKNKEENKSTNKKEWITPLIEIISKDAIEGGKHHGATENHSGYKLPSNPGQTTNGYS